MGARRKSVPHEKRALLYKVVELSNVDESSLEKTLNQWVSLGWKFDGSQFAMRESSKRPSMAFVFFTKEGPVIELDSIHDESFRSPDESKRKLLKLSSQSKVPRQNSDAWARLKAMSEDGEL